VFEYLRYDVAMGTPNGDYVDVSRSLECGSVHRYYMLLTSM
jgi:hypothetical protein